MVAVSWREQLRLALGLHRRTLHEVAQILGTHRNALQAVLSGRRSVSRRRLERWMDRGQVSAASRAAICRAWVAEADDTGDAGEVISRLRAENAALRAALAEGSAVDHWRRQEERVRDLEHRIQHLHRLARQALPHPDLLVELIEHLGGFVADLRPWVAPGVPPPFKPPPGEESGRA